MVERRFTEAEVINPVFAGTAMVIICLFELRMLFLSAPVTKLPVFVAEENGTCAAWGFPLLLPATILFIFFYREVYRNRAPSLLRK